jgi:hypothetical protein
VPAGRREQRQPVLRPAGRGEQVCPGHHRADERVLFEREQLERPVRACGQAAQQLVRFRPGRCLRDRAGQVIGGVVHLTAVESLAGLIEVLVGRTPIFHGSCQSSRCCAIASLGDDPRYVSPETCAVLLGRL